MSGPERGYILCADVGNTTLHAGVWAGKWVTDERWDVSVTAHPKELAVALQGMVSQAGLGSVQCSALVACANAAAAEVLARVAREALRAPALFAGHDLPVDLPVAYDEPETYGTDRKLALLAAREQVGTPAIVIDAGTCITCDAINQKGEAVPVGIAAGLPALTRGLQCAAPGISEAVGEAAGGEIGASFAPARSTRQSVSAGLTAGLRGTVLELVSMARRLPELEGGSVLVTGGDAALVRRLCKCELVVAPMLVLDGVRILYETRDQ